MVRPERTRRFVLTGATGYLGPWLAREIVGRYGRQSLVCLIPKPVPPSEQKSLAYLQNLGILCHPCQLMECPIVEGKLPHIDVLIHMAANTRTDLPDRDLQVNTVGTSNLLQTFGTLLRGKRVVFTSTSAAVDRDARPQGLLTEESPCRPRTGYGRTKLEAEKILGAKGQEFGFEYTILRLTTLYGPGMRGGLFYVLADWARRGHFLAKVNWPGRASFIFVEDAARIVLWFCLTEAGKNQTYFLSSGEMYRVGQLAELISKKIASGNAMLRLPKWFWGAMQRLIWLPVVKRFIPWRLANVIDDSLLCDSSRMRAIYPGTLTTLQMGLERAFGSEADCDEVARALA